MGGDLLCFSGECLAWSYTQTARRFHWYVDGLVVSWLSTTTLNGVIAEIGRHGTKEAMDCTDPGSQRRRCVLKGDGEKTAGGKSRCVKRDAEGRVPLTGSVAGQIRTQSGDARSEEVAGTDKIIPVVGECRTGSKTTGIAVRATGGCASCGDRGVRFDFVAE